jgi:hypothetical protein
MAPPNGVIVDWGAFCEVIFFYISTKNLLGDFFDSLSCHRVLACFVFNTIFHIEINGLSN